MEVAEDGPAVSPRVRVGVYAFLLVFAITRRGDASRCSRSAASGSSASCAASERESWQLRAVDATGDETPIRLGDAAARLPEHEPLLLDVRRPVRRRSETRSATRGPLRCATTGADVVGRAGLRGGRRASDPTTDRPRRDARLRVRRARDARSRALDRWLFAPEPAGRVRAMRADAGGADRVPAGHRPVPRAGRPAGRAVPTGVVPRLDGPDAVGRACSWPPGRRASAPPCWRSLGVAGAGHVPGGVVEPARARRAAARAAARSSTTTFRCCWWPAVLACAPVGLRLLDQRRAPAWGWPVRTSLVVVAGMYFLTGFQKVVSSGPAWVLSDNLRNVMYGAPPQRARPHRQVSLYIADRPAARPPASRSPRSWWSSAPSACSLRPRLRPWYLVAVGGAARRASTSPTASTTRCGSAPPPSCSSTGTRC